MTFRRSARILAALVGLAVAAVAVAIVAVLAFGISIDASRWREALAARTTAALGRPVRFEGPLELALGRETVLRARDVRVLNPPGFAAPELATVGTAEIRVALLAVLRSRLHVREIALADGRVRLARSADDGANWTLPKRPGAARDATAAPVAIELERLTVRNVAVDYADARAEPRRVADLDELVGTGGWDTPITLVLRGRVRGSVPCALAAAGGSPRRLQDGDADWPFTLDLECPHTRLRASGTLDAGRGAARFSFDARTGNLAEVENLLQEALPGLGAARLAGKVTATADALELTDLQGVLGEAELAGQLRLERGGARPRVTGEVAVATLDLRPLLRVGRQPAAAPLTYDDLVEHQLPLRRPVPIDVDLALHVQRLLGLPVEVRDARLGIHADERGVRAPLTATVAGVPLEGRIELDVAGFTPAVALEVGAQNVPFAGWSERLTGAPGLAGGLGRVALRLGGRGETLGALVRDLELRLEVAAARLRYGEFAGGRPVELTLDALELAIPRRQRLRGRGRGTLLGEPVRLAVRGGDLAQLLRGLAPPIELDLAAAGATAGVSIVPAAPEAGRGADLAFRLDAPRSGELARWLGVAPDSTLPVALRGRLQVERDGWRLEDTTLRLGRSELTVDAQRVVIDGRPVGVVAVRSPLIDVPELETLLPRRGPAPPHRLASLVDVPILPRRIDLADADIGFGLGRVVFGRAELADVGFSARIRDGRLPPSPYAARFAGVPAEGLVALDLRGEVPEVTLSLSAKDVDVGGLLRTLGVAEIIDERAATLEVELASRGSVLGELLEHASLTARLGGGDLTVRGPAERPVASLRVKEAVATSGPGGPLAVRLEGAVNDEPATVTVSSGTLADLARTSARVPLAVDARAAGTHLTLAGEATLPLGRGGELTLEMAGERLDSLSGLVRADLPPWGPWSIRGPIARTASGYEVAELTVRVGQSRLYGSGRLDLTGVRPRLEARISAPSIRLDDFPYETRPGPATAGELGARAREAADQTEALLSRAFLRRFDALVDVHVEQLLSGTDRLADGKLRATLDGGRLVIDPLEVNAPGGGARLHVSYDTSGPDLVFAAGAHIERFQYGILARRIRPDVDVAGAFSLDLALQSTAPSLDSIMRRADGHIDLAVWPENLRSGGFDRLSVNVFFAVLPFLDAFTALPFLQSGAESQVNCFIGRFDLKGGILSHDAIVIDTTRVRALGSGTADFRTEEIAFRFRPRAKGVTFFSLQTPLSVSGTMTDFTVRASPGDIFEALARFFAEVIVVPLEILVRGPLPRDGADVCTDPLRVREPAKR